MAREDDPVSYLAALKREGAASGASATARVSDAAVHYPGLAANSAGHRTFAGLEKRRSPRYKCEGSAQMCEEGSNLRTWATCTDISMHGCYVEAATAYPEGTVLHIKIETSDFRIEARGCVRVAYPQLGMGIAFTTMSEEDRTRLRELLRSLSCASVVMGPAIAASVPAIGPEPMPQISDPKTVTSALLAFFEKRQMLTRSEFLLLVRRSQAAVRGTER